MFYLYETYEFYCFKRFYDFVNVFRKYKKQKKNLILYLNDELEREIPLKILNYLSYVS